MVIFTILLIISIITYIVFAIMALIRVSLDEQKNLCYNSNLWFYCCISIIIILKINITFKNIRNKKNIILVIELLITIAMIVWGAYEFFGIDCTKNLNNTTLYLVTFIYWLSQIIFLGFLTIIIFNNIIAYKNNKSDNLYNDYT
jgi:hypothetical protein